MKWLSYTPLALPFAAIVSCGNFQQPLGGDFDPLAKPGMMNKQEEAVVSNYDFKVGSYVTAASNSTAFFSQRPQGNAEAQLLLAAGTSMRVVKTEGSFVKVELEDGKVGYVAAAMLSTGAPIDSSAIQVYPPVGGDAALPLPGGAGELPPAITPLPPTDAISGAPVPPIEPPTIPDLPPPSTPTTGDALPPPATGGADMKKSDTPAAEATDEVKEKTDEIKKKVEESVELPEPAGGNTPPLPPPVEAPKPE